MKNLLKPLLFLVCTTLLIQGCRKPTANFTADKTEVEIGEVVTFTNISEDAAVYMWDFGDGTQSTQKNPTHVYQAPGDYQVTLTSAKYKNKKAIDAPAVMIKVKAPVAPLATFTASKTSAMPGEVISFAATDTAAEEFIWDFGDGGLSFSPEPTHVYQTGGTYTVSLTVYGWDRKYSDTKTQTITIGNGSGDFGVSSKLVGKWKISSHTLTHMIGTTSASVCGTIYPQPESYPSFSPSTTPVIEVLTNGNILQYDNDNNLRNTSTYSVLDATRISWTHQGLYNTGNPFSPTIQGTRVPIYGTNPLWTITTLDATTFTITFSYKNQNAAVTNNCVTPNQTISGVQIITETVTYTKQ